AWACSSASAMASRTPKHMPRWAARRIRIRPVPPSIPQRTLYSKVSSQSGLAMTTLDRLRHWSQAGLISEEQHQTLRAVVSKERFSLYVELNALLYLGVLSLVAGL